MVFCWFLKKQIALAKTVERRGADNWASQGVFLPFF